ncbi:MAG: YbhB/YbcL family Raf kinase inhibitor-like protein [Candidatus Peribacteraceae bacterium]|nr:YbhB/YbcL family Raf kinase inhibitor-like protein [Candidatus Peribacteraceae bacterium]
MTITSPAFSAGGPIPVRYTCDGENVSPPLLFTDIPDGTQSLVLLVDDSDARGWVHWLVYGIDPAVREVEEGTVPLGGSQGVTSFGERTYGGPCPPSDTHRYVFHLFALDRMVLFEKTPDAGQLTSSMEGHILATATLTGNYAR